MSSRRSSSFCSSESEWGLLRRLRACFGSYLGIRLRSMHRGLQNSKWRRCAALGSPFQEILTLLVMHGGVALPRKHTLGMWIMTRSAFPAIGLWVQRCLGRATLIILALQPRRAGVSLVICARLPHRPESFWHLILVLRCACHRQ